MLSSMEDEEEEEEEEEEASHETRMMIMASPVNSIIETNNNNNNKVSKKQHHCSMSKEIELTIPQDPRLSRKKRKIEDETTTRTTTTRTRTRTTTPITTSTTTNLHRMDRHPLPVVVSPVSMNHRDFSREDIPMNYVPMEYEEETKEEYEEETKKEDMDALRDRCEDLERRIEVFENKDLANEIRLESWKAELEGLQARNQELEIKYMEAKDLADQREIQWKKKALGLIEQAVETEVTKKNEEILHLHQENERLNNIIAHYKKIIFSRQEFDSSSTTTNKHLTISHEIVDKDNISGRDNDDDNEYYYSSSISGRDTGDELVVKKEKYKGYRSMKCEICFIEIFPKEEKWIQCYSCPIQLHCECAGLLQATDWRCALCAAKDEDPICCSQCQYQGGYLIHLGNQVYKHYICSKFKFGKVCAICDGVHGPLRQCEVDSCETSYHFECVPDNILATRSFCFGGFTPQLFCPEHVQNCVDIPKYIRTEWNQADQSSFKQYAPIIEEIVTNVEWDARRTSGFMYRSVVDFHDVLLKAIHEATLNCSGLQKQKINDFKAKMINSTIFNRLRRKYFSKIT